MKISSLHFHISKWYQYVYNYIIAILCFYFLAFFLSKVISPTLQYQFIWQTVIFSVCLISFQCLIKLPRYKKLNVKIKNAEATIQRYDALSNATNDAIWDYDMKSESVFYNDRLMTVFGYSKEELSNNTTWWENNIHADDKERVINKMNNLLEKNKTTWEDEYRFRCKNGDYKIVFDRSYIVRDKNKQPLRLIGAMKDVTQLRGLEKLALNKQLKQKNVFGKKIIVSYENERKKIKDELHEDVNQLLASIKFYITTNKYGDENLSQGLLHLDDVMKKINKISNELYSSTLEILGFEDAINDLFEKFNKRSFKNITLNLYSFDEKLTEKESIVHLYKIIENRISTIISNINTKKINVVLSNDEFKTILKIQFTTNDTNVAAVLNDGSANDINVKLEMYEGKMKLVSVGDNEYAIMVVL